MLADRRYDVLAWPEAGSPRALARARAKQAAAQLTEDQFDEIASTPFDPQTLRDLIDALGYTPYKFSQAIGTSTSNVSRWLSGRPPAGDFMVRIVALAHAVGIEFDVVNGVKRTRYSSSPAFGQSI